MLNKLFTATNTNFQKHITKRKRKSQSHECGIYKDDTPIGGMSSLRNKSAK